MLGDIIGAGSKLLSSFLGNRSDDKQARQNIAHQKEFAQKGIQWKVKDAKAAGIHPLAALGAQTHSFTNVAGGSDYSGLAGAGQDLGRAVDATRDGKERMDAYTAELQKLQLQRGHLENQLLASQIAKVRQPGHPPASPNPDNPNLIAGQGDSPGIENKKMERAGWNPNAPSQEAGAVTDVGYVRTPRGWALVPSEEAKKRMEDMWVPQTQWAIRNLLVNPQPPADLAKDPRLGPYNYFTGEFIRRENHPFSARWRHRQRKYAIRRAQSYRR